MASEDTEEMDGKVFNEEEKKEVIWNFFVFLFFCLVWFGFLFGFLCCYWCWWFWFFYGCERKYVLGTKGKITAKVFSWQIHGMEKKYAF